MVGELKVDTTLAEVLDDGSCQTILVDGINGILAANGLVTIGCVQLIALHGQGAEMRVVRKMIARLSIPAAVLPGIVEVLQQQVQNMIADGSLPSATQEAENGGA